MRVLVVLACAVALVAALEVVDVDESNLVSSQGLEMEAYNRQIKGLGEEPVTFENEEPAEDVLEASEIVAPEQTREGSGESEEVVPVGEEYEVDEEPTEITQVEPAEPTEPVEPVEPTEEKDVELAEPTDETLDRRHRKKPRFCGKHSCPKYWSKKRKGYEIRCYAPSAWAYTKAEDKDTKYYKSEFMRLFRYIQGNNAEKRKIKMTVPVLTTMKYNLTDHTTKSGMGFYIPTKKMKNGTAPAPNDPKVVVKKTKKFCVYVRSFGGYVMGRTKTMYRQLGALTKSLKRDNATFVPFLSTFAGYNSPWQLFWRHNEVWRWMPKKKTQELLELIDESGEEDEDKVEVGNVTKERVEEKTEEPIEKVEEPKEPTSEEPKCSRTNPCGHNGWCNEDGVCKCPRGVTGTMCETKVEDFYMSCSSNPCQRYEGANSKCFDVECEQGGSSCIKCVTESEKPVEEKKEEESEIEEETSLSADEEREMEKVDERQEAKEARFAKEEHQSTKMHNKGGRHQGGRHGGKKTSLLGRDWRKLMGSRGHLKNRGQLFGGQRSLISGTQWDRKKHHRHHHKKNPRFCGKRSCPKFWTVARKWGYDVRCYWYSSWATTEADEVDQKTFKNEFWRLLKYIRGANADKKKMAMTVPVATMMNYNITDHKTKSSVSFYIPTKCNKTAPAPTDPKVSIIKLPKYCAYVRTFSGYSMGRTRLMYHNLFKMSKDLKRDGKSYQPGVSMFAGYNSPMQRFFRHNEVWRFPNKKEEEEYLATIEDKEFEETCEE